MTTIDITAGINQRSRDKVVDQVMRAEENRSAGQWDHQTSTAMMNGVLRQFMTALDDARSRGVDATVAVDTSVRCVTYMFVDVLSAMTDPHDPDSVFGLAESMMNSLAANMQSLLDNWIDETAKRAALAAAQPGGMPS